MLYNVLTRMIARGQVEGLPEKVDVFYAVGRLTEEQYRELSAMLEAAQ